MLKTVEATLMLSGMIIGVGMFAIPYSFASAGFWLGATELVILAGVVTLLHLLYGRLVMATPASHRLPGYITLYLGSRAGAVAWFSALFGISGTLLAYVLLGSQFLSSILSPILGNGGATSFAIVIVGVGSLITLYPLKKGALINGILTAVLVVFIVTLAAALMPHVETANLEGFDPSRAFVPYGVLLFALSGAVVIPDVIAIINRDRRKAVRVIILGTLVPALIYGLFAVAIVGVFGRAVAPDTISGLGRFGGGIVVLGGIIGFLAVFTSYLALNSSFQELLRLDWGLSRSLSWVMGGFIPLALYLLGFQNFILVISVVGAISIGIDSLLLVLSYHRLKKQEAGAASIRPVAYLWKAAFMLLIGAGIAQTLYQVLAGGA